MSIRIKHLLLLALSSSFVVLVGCEKQDGKVTNTTPSEPHDRIGQINSTFKGTIDYSRAQQNLRNREPYIINEKFQIEYSALVDKSFSRINSDKTRTFAVGSPSDSSQIIVEKVDCQNYRLDIGLRDDWFDAEAGAMSGRIAYTVCHLPASEF